MGAAVLAGVVTPERQRAYAAARSSMGGVGPPAAFASSLRCGGPLRIGAPTPLGPPPLRSALEATKSAVARAEALRNGLGEWKSVGASGRLITLKGVGMHARRLSLGNWGCEVAVAARHGPAWRVEGVVACCGPGPSGHHGMPERAWAEGRSAPGAPIRWAGRPTGAPSAPSGGSGPRRRQIRGGPAAAPEGRREAQQTVAADRDPPGAAVGPW